MTPVKLPGREYWVSIRGVGSLGYEFRVALPHLLAIYDNQRMKFQSSLESCVTACAAHKCFWRLAVAGIMGTNAKPSGQGSMIMPFK